MEGQSSAGNSQYQYQSAQWSRLVRRNTLADSVPTPSLGVVGSSQHPTHLGLLPILLPQQSSYHQAQLAQYNKLIASGRGVKLQSSPLPPLLSAPNIQAVPGPRSSSSGGNTERNIKSSTRAGHGNKDARKPSKGERALITEKEILATMPPKKFELSNQVPTRRPPAQPQNPTISQQSNSVPSTPHQHARKFSFASREPSPNPTTNHSPRSAYSESSSTLPSLRPLPPRNSGCRYENAMAHTRRRMAYSLGSDKLDKVKMSNVKSKLTEDEERTLSTDMRDLYDRLLPTPESEIQRQKLVQKLEKLFNDEWPGHDIRVHVFGSSGNLLCTDESDVDICITTEWKKLEGVCMIAELLAKSGMEDVICVSNAKVPIVKIWDPELRLACDMNVNNTLALENTRMVKTYVEIDHRVRPLAMIIKHWTKRRIVNDAAFGGTLSSYTWICMIIHFLQSRDPAILPALHQCEHTKPPTKEGEVSSFADDLDVLRDFGKKNEETLGELLFHFFRFYGHEFDYDKFVVSVRTGKQISKFEKKWHFTNNNRLCVEEPFNTGRNLGNTADDTSFRGLHMELRRAFDLISEAKLNDCCEAYEFPKEEERVWEKRPSQPKPVLSRSTSQSNRTGRGGSHRGGRHGNQHGRNNGGRRASSGTFDNNPTYPPQGLPLNLTQQDHQWLQHQAQAQLHNHLFSTFSALQAQETQLRQYQAYTLQQEAYSQARSPAPLGLSNPLPTDRNRTSSFDQPPLTAPIRQDMYFYPLQYQPAQMYAYQAPSTNPSSPSMSAAVPELRRSMHRSTITSGSGSGSGQSSSALRSHSQPAARSAPSPLSVQGSTMPNHTLQGLAIYPTVRHAHGVPIPNFIADENLDPGFEAVSSGNFANTPSEESTPKEYIGYYVNEPASSSTRAHTLPPLAIPAFGDLGQNRRRLSTEQFPQSILDRLKRSSRSPSPLGDGRHDRSCSVGAQPALFATTPFQQRVSSTNLRALNSQAPLVVDGSNAPGLSTTADWLLPRSEGYEFEDHNSDTAAPTVDSFSHNSSLGDVSGDKLFASYSTPKDSNNGGRAEPPMVVNGSTPDLKSVPGATLNGVSANHAQPPMNDFVSTEQFNSTMRLIPNISRSIRQSASASMSPPGVGTGQDDMRDDMPHLSPVYETRTPSPTVSRKFEPAMERKLNGATGNAKEDRAEQSKVAPKNALVNNTPFKPPTDDSKSNGHTRASKSEGGGPGNWHKIPKNKKKGHFLEQKSAVNGQFHSERPPSNDLERKGG